MHAFIDQKFQRNKVLIKTEAKDSKHTFLSQSLQKLKPNKDELINWAWWNVHVILAFGRWRQGN